MEKTLTFEQMMALFAEGRKESAEFRKNIEASIASSQKAWEEKHAAWEERQAKTEANIAKSEANIARLEVLVEKNNARLNKNTADMEKNNARLDKNTADLEKNNARLDKNNAKLDANNARLDANNAKLDANNAKLDANNEEVRNLTNKLGGIIESVVVPDIVERFNEKGFKFDSVCTRVEFLKEDKKSKLTEVDALLENGKFVIAVEAKTEMKKKDVNDHVKRLNKLRGLPKFRGKKIYGALATTVSRKESVNYALEKGFYVLQQPSVVGIKILDFPKGSSAKAW
jgi:chromosome segregation ATPase